MNIVFAQRVWADLFSLNAASRSRPHTSQCSELLDRGTPSSLMLDIHSSGPHKRTGGLTQTRSRTNTAQDLLIVSKINAFSTCLLSEMFCLLWEFWLIIRVQIAFHARFFTLVAWEESTCSLKSRFLPQAPQENPTTLHVQVERFIDCAAVGGRGEWRGVGASACVSDVASESCSPSVKCQGSGEARTSRNAAIKIGWICSSTRESGCSRL